MKSTALKNTEEEAVIRRIIDALDLPHSVNEYRVSLRPDHAGDPAAYLLFLMDDKLDKPEFLKGVSQITSSVMTAILDSPDTERYPFPHFRFLSEQTEMDARNPGQNW